MQLWKYLCSFADTKLSKYQLLPYIKQSHIDSLNTPNPKPSYFSKFATKTSPVKEKTCPKRPSEKNPTNPDSQPSTSTAGHAKEINSSPIEEDLIVDASQEDYFELQSMMPKNQKLKSKDDPRERHKKTPAVDIVSFFYSSDEEEPEKRTDGKFESFLDTLDKVAVKKVASESSQECASSMDVSNDELMEVCVEEPQETQPEKKEEKQKTPAKNKSSNNRKSLITDYFK